MSTTKNTKHRMSFPQKCVYALLNKMDYGSITLIEKDKTTQFTGHRNTDHAALVRVLNNKVYSMILKEGSLGAARAYIQGYWETDNLIEFLMIFTKNTAFVHQIETPLAKIMYFFSMIKDRLFPNTLQIAKKNILEHYDLGNDFFKLFLDADMMYSCAIYTDDDTSLENASRQKLKTICEKMALKPTDHVLEIGTGWGGLAIYMAQNYHCRVTTTTISDKQFAYVKSQIERLGLQDQIELLNTDYRQLQGKYDKIVSIEMIEAVGHRYFDTFFHLCNQLLKPNGIFFLQAIVIDDQEYQTALREKDFIKTYIFPGGCLPSVERINQSIAKETQLQLVEIVDIGPHYIKTLRDWHTRFKANLGTIRQQGFSEAFIRTWEYYFAYCMAGFEIKRVSDIHAVWRKPA